MTDEIDVMDTVTGDEQRNPWIVFGVAIALVLAVAAAYHYTLPPDRPTKWYTHAIFWAVAGVSFAIPTSISGYIFDSLSVTFIGTVFPIYESLRAICTPDEDDDKYWLQYHMVGGVLFICSQCVDEWLGEDDDAVRYWFQAMFFLYLWLYFPKTDGAAIIYNRFTEPYLAPLVQPATNKINRCFSYVFHSSINACHIALLVLFFVFFPDNLKKVIAVSVGTAYPLLSSIVAATTEDVEDDTYWLVLETWLGWIPGFYAFYIAATIYLMLPMFNGADKVFRKVLVPLARLQDLLILRDAVQIKKRILSDLDPEQAKAVRQAIVKFYDDDDEDTTIDQGALKSNLLTSWKSVQIPGFTSLFRKGSAKDEDGALKKQDDTKKGDEETTLPNAEKDNEPSTADT